MSDAPGELTRLLSEASAGNRDALDRLLPLVYRRLRSLAGRQLRDEREGHTLQPTALVHEAYLKLVDLNEVRWQDRGHFFAVAARAMRRILVNHGKHRRRQKRGGGRSREPLAEGVAASVETPLDVVALDEALTKLWLISERRGRVVELRYFGGLSIEETAEVLDVSLTTVKEDWALAKTWLLREISKGDDHEC